MNIVLGALLELQGKRFFCEEIGQWKGTEIAWRDSTFYRWMHESRWPHKLYLLENFSIADFVQGDVISVEYDRMQFRLVDRGGVDPNDPDTLVIYTSFVIRKEQTHGLEGSESGDSEATDSEAESTGQGTEDSSSAGTTSDGEGGSTLH